ncbi:Protein of unknown function [Bradyrhizobium sp. NFR13]|uniref:DUF3168 domain-containing protein n=1 Tax=Bradyrhizobium sp. NFR13 TaxID=1566285 RepID=UPI0008EEB2D8|nr:DUF3168 domain-containing protein [Bradyrhizobium sp. NFR13]SFM00630.1 Protein of unknown function [Bradyrhizobium sp. NFR13]
MSDGSFELQGAVFTVLSALSPDLVSGGIHAPAPQDNPLPYVEIGESDAVGADVQTRAGLAEAITIHVWTMPGSFAPAKQIMSRIRDALHAKKLTVSGRSAALANVTNTRVFTDDDGESVHGVVTLSVNHFGQKET